MALHITLATGATDPPGGIEGKEIARSDFLRKALLTGGALAAGGAVLAGLPRLSSAASSAEMDVKICNYFLLLERLQAAFYEGAIGRRAISGDMATFAETVVEHEREHVAFLESALGSDADDPPTFDFGDSTGSNENFSSAALLLEETATSAYIGQGPNMTKEKVIDAARIASVEGRHTAWIRDLLGENPAPNVADEAMSERQVLAALRDEGFIA
jgi:hypothetical protein